MTKTEHQSPNASVERIMVHPKGKVKYFLCAAPFSFQTVGSRLVSFIKIINVQLVAYKIGYMFHSMQPR